MRRIELIHAVSERLGDRRLVWFGTRGDDLESVADLPQLSQSFSLISAYRRRSSVQAMALEDLTGRRVDLDTYELDDHLRDPEVEELRRQVLVSLARPSVVFTYRPTRFLSAVTFVRSAQTQYLGLFNDHQAAFEHKPWVESAVANLGVPHLPWTYIADDDQLDTVRYLADGPIVLRRSRTTGGVGLVRLDHIDQLTQLWPEEEEAFVSVAPYVDSAIPVNVGAVAWADGVTVHPASVQLIGIPELTSRRFGYCGNDFGAVLDFEPSTLEAIDRSTVRIGDWLRSLGYRGAFGVDFLVEDGLPLFLEVNARFQGSTHLSCESSTVRDESCLLLEHLASFLGIAAPPSLPLVHQASDVGDLAHAVVHWLGADTPGIDVSGLVAVLQRTAGLRRADVETRPDLTTATGATALRATFSRRLTERGFDLTGVISDAIREWTRTQEAPKASESVRFSS